MDHEKHLEKIFSSLDLKKISITARESSQLEFKEAFNWNSRSNYAKSLVAFANNKGGYMVFGVSNNPRLVVGLKSQNFENIDEATMTAYFNSCFSPELQYEKFVIEIKGIRLGVLYACQAKIKPLIAIKNDGDIREADIYYRYNARNDRAKYPEIKYFFDIVKEEERKGWMRLFEKVSKIGPENTGVMDIITGSIEGKNGSLLIDQKLLSKIKFIKEGHFTETGKAALKLVGDVVPVTVSPTKRGVKTEFRLTDDPSAIAVREETILKDFPLEYSDLIATLNSRYTDFKLNNKFYEIKKSVVSNGKFCRSRYLDIKNSKGAKKDFYSTAILKEFDKHYTKGKVKPQ